MINNQTSTKFTDTYNKLEELKLKKEINNLN